MSRIFEKQLISSAESRWIQLFRLNYKDQEGKSRSWECAERTTRKGDCDAVAIMAVLDHQREAKETILITQYRPPVDSYVLEFPAGLIDQGETAEEAALRELKEETGYIGKVIQSTNIMVCDPGMTNANMKLASFI